MALKDVCSDLVGVSGINVRYHSKQQQESPLDRQTTTPENQASAELTPSTPLSKSLMTSFLLFAKG
jgi:hypothetical protein